MTVKELKEKLAKLPESLDDAKVYVYSRINEGADNVYSVEVYNEETHAKNYGTPYCKGDGPWHFGHDEKGHLITKLWEGNPPFVVIG